MVRSRAGEFAELPLIWAIGLIGPATLSWVTTRTAARSFWRGFALSGWIYLLLCFGPWLGPTIGPGLPTTTTLIDALHEGLQPCWRVTTVAWIGQTTLKGPIGGRVPGGSFPLRTMPASPHRSPAVGLHGMNMVHFAPRPEMDRRVGHCLICLAVGLLGGLAATQLGRARSSHDVSPSVP